MRLLLETPTGELKLFIAESRKAIASAFIDSKVHVVSPGETFDEAVERVLETRSAPQAKRNGSVR